MNSLKNTLSGWLLNAVYLLVLFACLPYLIYRHWMRDHRTKGWRQKVTGRLVQTPFNQQPIWIHAVSVGEVNLVQALILRCREQLPATPILLTTTTATGYDVACKRFPELSRSFWPFDFTWAARRALRVVNPRLVILAELEVWPNFSAIAQALSVPVIIVNGRISDRSFASYRRWRWLVRPMMARLSQVCAQDELSARRFAALGVPADRIQVTGNLKYDGINRSRDTQGVLGLRERYEFRKDELIWVAGSTQPDEDQIVINVFQRLRRDGIPLRLVIAPRHPEKVAPLLTRLQSDQEAYVLRSDEKSHGAAAITVVDVLGELSTWWALADVAFVGGSLNPRGGQNMIEPAAVGAAVCFGPNTQNFRDTVQGLLAAEAAVMVPDESSLEQFIRVMVANPDRRQQLGQRAASFVSASQGALERTWSCLQGWL